MSLSPTSFLIGLGTAMLLPALSRAFRPVAVEVGAAGLAVFAEVRRMLAEQKEAYEDIAAEARARYDERLVQADHEGNSAEPGEAEGEDVTVPIGRARRRPSRRAGSERPEG